MVLLAAEASRAGAAPLRFVVLLAAEASTLGFARAQRLFLALRSWDLSPSRPPAGQRCHAPSARGRPLTGLRFAAGRRDRAQSAAPRPSARAPAAPRETRRLAQAARQCPEQSAQWMQLAVNRVRVPEGHVNSVVRQFSTQQRAAACVRTGVAPSQAARLSLLASPWWTRRRIAKLRCSRHQ